MEKRVWSQNSPKWVDFALVSQQRPTREMIRSAGGVWLGAGSQRSAQKTKTHRWMPDVSTKRLASTERWQVKRVLQAGVGLLSPSPNDPLPDTCLVTESSSPPTSRLSPLRRCRIAAAAAAVGTSPRTWPRRTPGGRSSPSREKTNSRVWFGFVFPGPLFLMP